MELYVREKNSINREVGGKNSYPNQIIHNHPPPALKVKWLKDNNQNRAFSHDVTAAILVFQTNPVRVQFFCYVNALLFQICQSY